MFENFQEFEKRAQEFTVSLDSYKQYLREQIHTIEIEKQSLKTEKEKLEEFERGLEEREKQLQKDIISFKKKKKIISDLNSKIDYVELNVGGEVFSTKRSTLCAVEGSMLEAMFSGRHTLKQVNDRYVIDRDPKLFRYILAYLRDGTLTLPKKEEKVKLILQEFDYFCISPFRTSDEFFKRDWRNTCTLGGHDDIVMCLRVISKDLLISGSKDKTMRIWNISTGECVRVFRGHTSSVRHLKVMNDRIITASHDKTIKVWDMTTGEVLQTMDGHEEYVMCIKVVPNDGTLLSGSHDATIRCWDLTNGKCLRTLKGHASGVSCIKLVGKALYSGSDDKSIRMWDFYTGECKKVFTGHAQYVMSIKVRGNMLFSGSWDKTIRIWNITSGECLRICEGHAQGIYCIKVIDDSVLVSCSGDNTVKIWDVKTAVCHKTLEGHKRHVMSVKVFGKKIFTGSSDKTIKIWEPI